MREIKFRGKSLLGDWFYGSLVSGIGENNKPVTFIATGLPVGTSDFETFDTPMVAVKSETIGQYTGLGDENGQEIYEGDIVRLYGVVGSPDCVVKFYSGGFVSERPNGKLCQLREEPGLGSPACVIGNIHDNPELLKQ